MVRIDTVERTAIVAYALLQELHGILAEPGVSDEILLGILLATAMHCDDKVGPFRAQHLMQQAPHIALKSDAHVTETQLSDIAPVLRVFGAHLQTLRGVAGTVPAGA